MASPHAVLSDRLILFFDTSTGRICLPGKWSLPSSRCWWVECGYADTRLKTTLFSGAWDIWDGFSVNKQQESPCWSRTEPSSFSCLRRTPACGDSWPVFSCFCTPVPVFPLSDFAAISRWREPVWLKVHQPNAGRQPRWLHPQWECQSSLPGNIFQHHFRLNV